jgi:hypothetical protein
MCSERKRDRTGVGRFSAPRAPPWAIVFRAFGAANILAMTVGTVFSAEGLSASSYVSAPEFRGSRK